MFFARPGKYEPCGLFTLGHLILTIITITGIIIALKKTVKKSKDEIYNIIKKCTITIWIFEAIIITFKIITGGIRNVNNYVPLYYCSILLYAGGFASFSKNKLKRLGEVFLATGGIAGGLIFILLPTTSLPTYPILHIVSLHSFIFHGIMLYLGLLINITNYITINLSDIKYYAFLVGVVCIFANIINNIFDSNLMFISKNFEAITIINFLYKTTGRFFTLVTSLCQMTLPFYTIYVLKNICHPKSAKQNRYRMYLIYRRKKWIN